MYQYMYVIDSSQYLFPFQIQYPYSKACKMSKVRDLPPVSGSIIWARQASFLVIF